MTRQVVLLDRPTLTCHNFKCLGYLKIYLNTWMQGRYEKECRINTLKSCISTLKWEQWQLNSVWQVFNLSLKICSDGYSITSGCGWFQCLTVISIKVCFFSSVWQYFPWCKLNSPLPTTEMGMFYHSDLGTVYILILDWVFKKIILWNIYVCVYTFNSAESLGCSNNEHSACKRKRNNGVWN